MRTAFIETLVEIARTDERIFLLTADLGWSVLERFRDAFPERFLNVGVAEQNMVGIATGLAQVGFVPFVYSIATFASMRCYEQIRNGPVLHNLPVRVIGIGGGFDYGHAGPTHYGVEDLAIGRTQPGLTVLAPSDRAQTRAILHRCLDLPGPAYLRIGKGNETDVPGLKGRFDWGRPEVVREGTDLLFLCIGSIAHEALAAADLCKRNGINAAVAVLAHLSYAPTPELARLLGRFPHVITAEEGYTAGGLGSLAAETIAQEHLPCQLCIHGIKGRLPGLTGSTRFMREQFGLTALQLAQSASHNLSIRRVAA